MSLSTVKSRSIFGATMLIAGCCIGAGMIGLPVVSALAGFLPSSLAMLLCYIFTTLTGLLLLEATLWFEDSVNLPSIVEFTLGKTGKALTLMLFLFLFYCLFVAYLDGGGQLFADILSSVFHHSVSHTTGILTCLSLVAIITYAGTKIVDNFNRVLILGLVISYLVLISIGLPKINTANLANSHWISSFSVIPILLICFGYQNLVPSIIHYLDRNVKAIRIAIVLGNFIPFMIYLLWDYVILGMLPAGSAFSVKDADMVVQLLQGAIPSLSIIFFIKAFSLFALLTSFLPNAISLVDFIRDGFKKTFAKTPANGLSIYVLVFLPPLICTLVYPHLFIHALSFAGGFIDVLLFGILPALVILVGRNIKKISGPYRVVGGNFTPVFILLCSGVILYFKLGF